MELQQSIESMAARSDWVLSERNESDGSVRLVNINTSPFRIGRLPNLSLSLSSNSISKQHAELTVQAGRLEVRDLGSTNGTFVNGRRIQEPTLLHPTICCSWPSSCFESAINGPNHAAARSKNAPRIGPGPLPVRPLLSAPGRRSPFPTDSSLAGPRYDRLRSPRQKLARGIRAAADDVFHCGKTRSGIRTERNVDARIGAGGRFPAGTAPICFSTPIPPRW